MAEGTSGERREKKDLRELLDELIDQVRNISNREGSLSDSEAEYAQQRLAWLAEEVAQLAIHGNNDRL